MRFIFENKVWTGEKRKSGIRILLIVSAVLLALLTIFRVLMEGLAGLDWISGGVLILVVISILWPRAAQGRGYVTASTMLDFYPGGLTIRYLDIDRGRGPVDEEWNWREQDIQEILFSSQLQAVRIFGWPYLTVNREGRQEQYDYGERKHGQEIILYLPQKDLNAILQAFRIYIRTPVIRVDERRDDHEGR